jgi:hypothetical protein
VYSSVVTIKTTAWYMYIRFVMKWFVYFCFSSVLCRPTVWHLSLMFLNSKRSSTTCDIVLYNIRFATHEMYIFSVAGTVQCSTIWLSKRLSKGASGSHLMTGGLSLRLIPRQPDNAPSGENWVLTDYFHISVIDVVRIEPTISEMKCHCSDNCTTKVGGAITTPMCLACWQVKLWVSGYINKSPQDYYIA